MSAPLKTYRVYCFDAAHRILTADFVEAASDEDAIAKAEAAGFGSKCELWEGRRLVAKLEAERREAQRPRAGARQQRQAPFSRDLIRDPPAP